MKMSTPSTSSEEDSRSGAPVKSRKRPKLCCNLCGVEDIPDFEAHQPQLEFQDLRAHYFCLLFSSGLGQSGEEHEGLKGFMPPDVRKELKRGARLKCVYCKLKGATVGCAKQECKKSYHLPCGMKHGSLQQYFDQFKSYCPQHRPMQKVGSDKRQKSGKGANSGQNCSICHESVMTTSTSLPDATSKALKSLWAPCCKAWFHRTCVQTMALNHGEHHFKCPLCNNNDTFSGEMQKMGIYLPQRDASWEAPSTGLDESHAQECGAKVCFCDKEGGREYQFPDGLWELMVCYACGSEAIHAKCGGMEDLIDPQWHCYTCRRVVKQPHTDDERRKKRPINEIWGTALGRKPPTMVGVTISPKNMTSLETSPFIASSMTAPPRSTFKNAQLANTVTITPIPKYSSPMDFPMRCELPGGVEIRMVVPKAQESQPHRKDTLKLSLDDIILAGLARAPEETNYKCTKAFAEQYAAATPPTSKRHNSLDNEQVSPGDSDYESAQEASALPFKIRKNPHVTKKNVNVGSAEPQALPSPADTLDSQIQKTIKDFFTSAS